MPSEPSLVALPLVLHMGWKNNPPIFSTVTETIADIVDKRLRDDSYQPPVHNLDTLAESVNSDTLPPLLPHEKVSTVAVFIPPHQDPSLPTTAKPLQ